MKRLFIVSLLAFVLVVGGATNVTACNPLLDDCSAEAEANASANVGDVSGGNASANVDNTNVNKNSNINKNANLNENNNINVNNVEGGNATIEKGAVNNSNNQAQIQGQEQSQSQDQGQFQNQSQNIDKGAVQNSNNNTIENGAVQNRNSNIIDEGAVQNSNSNSQSQSINEGAVQNTNTVEEGAVQNSNSNSQSQTSTSNVSNSGNNTGNSEVSITYEDERELPNAQAPHSTPQASPFTARPGEMHQFFSMKKLFDVKKTWTRAELKGLVHKRDGAIRDSRQIAYTDRDEVPSTITVVYDTPENGKMLGIIKVWLEDSDGDSIRVIGNAMNFALNEMKGSKIMPVNEGARKILKSFSWSIGLTWSTMHVSSDSGSAGSGGTGISGASLGYEAEPFVRFFVFE